MLDWPGRSDTLLAVEVVVLWRGDTLTVSHLRLPGTFFVGEGVDSCGDISLPRELLGSERVCVAVGSHRQVFAVLPPHASGWLTLPDGSTQAFEDASELALAEGSSPDERLLALGIGYRAQLCFGDIEIQVAPVQAERAALGRWGVGFQASMLAYFALSSFSVGGLLAASWLLAPPPGLNRDERVEAERLRLVQRYLTASEERATERREQTPAAPSLASAAARRSSHRGHSPPDVPRGASRILESEERSSADAPALGASPDAAPRAALKRQAQLQEARDLGLSAFLRESFAWLADPRFMFKRELDGAEVLLMEQLFLEADGDPTVREAPGGLSLSGTGLGSGGRANVIALGAVGTVSEGEGKMPEHFAHVARATGSHRPDPSRIRHVEGLVSEQIPAALIRRTVNRNFAKLRACYEQGRANDAALAGSVRVSFAVLRDGQVDYVSTSGSELPSEDVLECIERAFYGFRFPSPGSSPANITYPFQLSPRG